MGRGKGRGMEMKGWGRAGWIEEAWGVDILLHSVVRGFSCAVRY